jgi:hypothetical protein
MFPIASLFLHLLRELVLYIIFSPIILKTFKLHLITATLEFTCSLLKIAIFYTLILGVVVVLAAVGMTIYDILGKVARGLSLAEALAELEVEGERRRESQTGVATN